MNSDRMDTLSLELKIIEGSLAFFVKVNGAQILGEYNTDVLAFFSQFEVDSSLQKQAHNGLYYTESEFYPLSCSCGEAGCNGFFDGIYQKNRKYSVEWRVDPKYYARTLPKRYYSFLINNYRKSVLGCWWWLVEALRNSTDLNSDALERIQEIVETVKDWHPRQYAQLMASRKEYDYYLKIDALLSDIRLNHG